MYNSFFNTVSIGRVESSYRGYHEVFCLILRQPAAPRHFCGLSIVLPVHAHGICEAAEIRKDPPWTLLLEGLDGRIVRRLHERVPASWSGAVPLYRAGLEEVFRSSV